MSLEIIFLTYNNHFSINYMRLKAGTCPQKVLKNQDSVNWETFIENDHHSWQSFDVLFIEEIKDLI